MNSIISALQAVFEAHQELQECRERFSTSYAWRDWSDYGERELAKLEAAETDFLAELNKHIDDRIEAATGARP